MLRKQFACVLVRDFNGSSVHLLLLVMALYYAGLTNVGIWDILGLQSLNANTVIVRNLFIVRSTPLTVV
jgi:hypothetical protein